MKIQNTNLANTELSVEGQLFAGDANGIFDLPAEAAEELLATKGWGTPTADGAKIAPPPTAKSILEKAEAARQAAAATTAEPAPLEEQLQEPADALPQPPAEEAFVKRRPGRPRKITE